MKNTFKYFLQKLLGYQNYLMLFAHFKIVSLAKDKNEADFFSFLKLLNEPNIVLDIGANIGIMTVHLANRFKNTKIHSFEPMPSNVSVLERIVKRYQLKNVTIHELALGNKEGTLKMVLPENKKTKMQGLSHVVHESISDWNIGKQVEVKASTLDFLFPTEKIDGIKLDVENFEYFVLLGGQQLIERSHPLIYTELWDNENRNKCFDFLKKLSYKAFVVVDNQLVAFQKELHSHQNFIFKPEKID